MMNSKEVWKPVTGYQGLYEVSNLGRIKSFHKNKEGNILSLNKTNGNGYLISTLCKNSKKKNYYNHRLVASEFVKRPKGNHFVNHIDANITNNEHSNLEWVTSKQNIQHAIKLGNKWDYGENSPNSKLTKDDLFEIRKLLKEGDLYQYEIAEIFNVAQTTISRIKLSKTYAKY